MFWFIVFTVLGFPVFMVWMITRIVTDEAEKIARRCRRNGLSYAEAHDRAVRGFGGYRLARQKGVDKAYEVI